MTQIINITKPDNSKITGKVINIEFEGTDGGYPVYTAAIMGSDGKTYYTSSSRGNGIDWFDYELWEESENDWLYPIT